MKINIFENSFNTYAQVLISENEEQNIDVQSIGSMANNVVFIM